MKCVPFVARATSRSWRQTAPIQMGLSHRCLTAKDAVQSVATPSLKSVVRFYVCHCQCYYSATLSHCSPASRSYSWSIVELIEFRGLYRVNVRKEEIVYIAFIFYSSRLVFRQRLWLVGLKRGICARAPVRIGKTVCPQANIAAEWSTYELV